MWSLKASLLAKYNYNEDDMGEGKWDVQGRGEMQLGF
jgi:hypothetical protein